MNLRSKLLASTLSFGTVLGGFGLVSAATATAVQLPPASKAPPPSLVSIPPITIDPCAINPKAPGCGPIITIPPKVNPCLLNPKPKRCPDIPEEKPDPETPDPRHPEPETPDSSVDTPVKGRPTFTG